MAFKSLIIAIAIMALLPSRSLASDPSPLQDFCVAVDDSKNAVFVNGKFCKDPKLVVAEDFFKSGLNMPGNTSNNVGSAVTPVKRQQLTRIEHSRHSLARIDYAPYGLIHFQFNPGKTKTVAFAGLSSQNPGVITIANAVFGSDPPISDDVLAKAFQIDKKGIDYLQSKFWWDNN
uniref:Germin-like protein n=1 Tax=Solanum tuberosum TaxID=4113 RepID=M1BUZ0_SOLTU